MAEFITDIFPVARKAHWCRTCLMPIDIGTRYRRATMRNDGRVYAWIEHLECQELGTLSQQLDPAQEGYDAATLADWLRDLGEEDAVAAVSSEAAKARIRLWFALEELRVGKKAAGRLLDGRTWDEVPRG